jgi:uncharacterized protein (DUF983 family)
MIKDFILFIKYPYTAGIIGTIWLGTAAFLAIEPEMPTAQVVLVTMAATVIIALVGFRGKQEI